MSESWIDGAAKAIQAIEMVGDEVTWEIFKTGDLGRWYVTAQHRGSDNPDDNFKFGAAGANLAEAVSIVAAECFEHGPKWLKS